MDDIYQKLKVVTKPQIREAQRMPSMNNSKHTHIHTPHNTHLGI